MNSHREQEEKFDFAQLDKKRIFIAAILFGLVGLGGFLAKDKVSQFLAQKQNVSEEQTAGAGSSKEEAGGKEDEEGKIAGAAEEKLTLDAKKQDLQKQIDKIKETIAKLKPEDIKEQAPVQKILSDLDELSKKATESAKILDVKGNLCEEAKRRFCE